MVGEYSGQMQRSGRSTAKGAHDEGGPGREGGRWHWGLIAETGRAAPPSGAQTAPNSGGSALPGTCRNRQASMATASAPLHGEVPPPHTGFSAKDCDAPSFTTAGSSLQHISGRGGRKVGACEGSFTYGRLWVGSNWNFTLLQQLHGPSVPPLLGRWLWLSSAASGSTHALGVIRAVQTALPGALRLPSFWFRP